MDHHPALPGTVVMVTVVAIDIVSMETIVIFSYYGIKCTVITSSLFSPSPVHFGAEIAHFPCMLLWFLQLLW